MTLSACIWAVSGPEESVLSQIAQLGFQTIDIRPNALQEETSRSKVRDLNLTVTCIAASAGMPEGASLDSLDTNAVEQALTYTKQALDHGASVGVSAAYVVPKNDASDGAMSRYADALVQAADHAQTLGIKLCIEHFPGSCLPTIDATLTYLSHIGHPNLYLLLDIGHAQMSNEDPAEAVRTARSRLGYFHLDDNDGENDLHLSLLDGVLTEDVLSQTFAALQDIHYDGPVSLELKDDLPDPLSALKTSRDIVLKVAPNV